MASVLQFTVNTYTSNIRAILLFSIASFIAFLIPGLASFPTYVDAGAIFLRTASVFSNLTLFSTAVIIISVLFSLLFLSFAIVAVTIVTKHSRTKTKVTQAVMSGLEKYTARVFGVLVLYSILIFVVNILSYYTSYGSLLTAIVGLAAMPLVFYAPASIVIDDNKIYRAVEASWRFFTKELSYPALWLAIAIISLTVADFILIFVSGTSWSRYLMLAINSFVVLPFLMVLQGEAYMHRFKMLKH